MATAEVYSSFGYTTVNLALSVAEAETLRFLVARVGGDPDDSPRKHTDSIGHALDKAGVTEPYLAVVGDMNCIYFLATCNGHAECDALAADLVRVFGRGI